MEMTLVMSLHRVLNKAEFYADFLIAEKKLAEKSI
jgi:hypothetical protein